MKDPSLPKGGVKDPSLPKKKTGSKTARTMGEKTSSRKEPATSWSNVFGEALASPEKKTLARNHKLGSLTPGGHLSEESATWLAHHQEVSQLRLERRCSRLVRLRQLPSPRALSEPGLLVRLSGPPGANALRSPPHANVQPQLVVFELELLLDTFSTSFWNANPTKEYHCRPGVVSGLRFLARQFLLCALCRSRRRDACALLAMLRDRGISFDSAYLVPPNQGAGQQSAPCLRYASLNPKDQTKR